MRLCGPLDESVSFDPCAEIIGQLSGVASATLELDLGEVRRLNSTGIFYWMKFMTVVKSAGIPVAIVAMSEPFVSTIGIVANIFNGVKPKVLSFEAPYFCPTCNRGTCIQVRPLEVTITSDHRFSCPVRSCPGCGGKLDFDDVDSEYFNFLRSVSV